MIVSPLVLLVHDVLHLLVVGEVLDSVVAAGWVTGIITFRQVS